MLSCVAFYLEEVIVVANYKIMNDQIYDSC